jgi:hypothetical protein
MNMYGERFRQHQSDACGKIYYVYKKKKISTHIVQDRVRVVLGAVKAQSQTEKPPGKSQLLTMVAC